MWSHYPSELLNGLLVDVRKERTLLCKWKLLNVPIQIRKLKKSSSFTAGLIAAICGSNTKSPFLPKNYRCLLVTMPNYGNIGPGETPADGWGHDFDVLADMLAKAVTENT